MPESDAQSYYFDTVTLSNFALSQSVGLLVARYGKRLFITHEVRDEISDGIASGFSALSIVDTLLFDGSVSLALPIEGVRERQCYLECLRILSAGEASCIVCAVFRGGVVATDDLAARNYCRSRAIPVTGTIGILQRLCRNTTITREQADSTLAAMIAAGFYSPIKSFKDIL